MFAKKIVLWLILLFTIWAFPMVAKADCTYERVAELSRIAGNVKFSYDYEMVNGMPVFNVTMTNITNDIYIIDDIGSIFDGTNEIVKQYNPGEDISFWIYSNDDMCRGEQLLLKHVSLPSYNGYSTVDICKNSDHELCSMWGDTSSVSFEQFFQKMKDYNTLKNPENPVEKQKTTLEKVLEIVKENLYLGIIFLGLVGLLIVKQRMR